jgi:pilus assembly protein CpaF
VVGEVRGAEICDLLTAMNTGHEGGCGTVHANSTADIPARLEALASLGGVPRHALHAQLASALDAVIHVARDDSGMRRVAGDFDLGTRASKRTGSQRVRCGLPP